MGGYGHLPQGVGDPFLLHHEQGVAASLGVDYAASDGDDVRDLDLQGVAEQRAQADSIIQV